MLVKELVHILLVFFVNYVASKADVITTEYLQDQSQIRVARNDNESVTNNLNHNGGGVMLTMALQEDHHLMSWNFHHSISVVTEILWELLNIETSGCNFMIATMDSDNALVIEILRRSSTSTVPVVILDLNSRSQTPSEHLLQDAWGRTTLTCRTLMVDLTSDSDLQMLRALDKQKLWLWPNEKVLMVGTAERAQSVIQHPALANSIQPLYLRLGDHLGLEDYLGLEENPDEEKERLSAKRRIRKRNLAPVISEVLRKGFGALRENGDYDKPALPRDRDYIHLYSRCLYCNNGESKTTLQFSWSHGLEMRMHTLARNSENFEGHLMKVISFKTEPLSSYKHSEDGPGGVVTMQDSFDKRLLEAMSAALNFTYEVRSPNTSDLGSPREDGSWSGVLGTLYNKDIDFTTIIGNSQKRVSVMDHINVVHIEQLIIISLKPVSLPQYLVFFRTFSEIVWILVVFSFLMWGASVRLLQGWRSSFAGNRVYSLDQEIFYGLSMLLWNPIRQATNITSQMLVCWWLIFSFLVSTFFKSSLVALLTVEGKTEPIDSFSDLVKQDNWAWGIDDEMTRGLLLAFFKENANPDIRYLFDYHEKIDRDEGLEKVLKGRYSLLSGKDSAIKSIGSKYTKRYEESPFHFSKANYDITPIGWGCRKGAPFTGRFLKAITRLKESGISDRWLEEVRASNIHEIKENNKRESKYAIATEDAVYKALTHDDSNRRVLETIHMIGIYLILIVGLYIASLVFIWEKLAKRICCNEE